MRQPKEFTQNIHKYLCLFCLCIMTFSGWAQENPADTLNARYALTKGDSLWQLQNYAESEPLLQEALTGYETHNFLQHHPQILSQLSEVYWRTARYEEAKKASLRALSVYDKLPEQQKNPLYKANAHTNLGTINYLEWKPKDALEHAFIAMGIYESDSIYLRYLGTIYDRIGLMYGVLGEVNTSLNYNLKSLQIREAVLGRINFSTAGSYNNIGLAMADKGDYEQALKYFQISQDIFRELFDADHPQVLNALFNIGSIYQATGEYGRAQEYYLLALEAFSKSPELYQLEISNAYNNIGVSYLFDKQYDLALEWHKKAVDLRRSIYGEMNSQVAFSYNNIGLVHREKFEDSLALHYHFRALAIQSETLPEFHTEIALTHLGIAQVYLGQKEHEKALFHFEKAQENSQKNFGNFHPQLAEIHNFIARTYLSSGDYNSGIKAIESALYSNTSGRGVTTELNLDSLAHLSPSPIELIRSFGLESQLMLLKSEQTGDLSYAKLALSKVEISDQVIDRVRKLQLRHADKLNFGEVALFLYHNAIAICWGLYTETSEAQYIEKAFLFSEKAKASILTESLLQREAKEFTGISNELLRFEDSLKIERSFYQSQLANGSPQGDTLQQKGLENKVFAINYSLDSLILALERDYPEYHQLKYQNQTRSISDIQQMLSRDQAIIEFAMGDSLIYSFLIARDQVEFFSTPKDSLFLNTLNEFTIYLSNEQSVSIKGFDRFKSTASYLYKQLLDQPLNQLEKEIKHISIIPSAELSTFPWDVLLSNTQGDNFNELNYLFNQYTISYGYSVTLLFKEEETLGKSPKETLLAFAPVYEGESIPGVKATFREALVPLKWNQPEVESITQNLQGTSFLGETATEKKFKELAPNFQILHLAMHALVDHQESMNSKLVFTQDNDSIEDGMLHTFELFNMELPAEMVVLSACNTGVGELQKGEGVMNLARAFAYAGVPSLIMSHWNVNDESTARLMTSFYKHLATGKRKDEALRLAKLDFLSEAMGVKAHPFFWGGFVVVGDTDPLERSKPGNWIWWAIALITGGFLLFTVTRKRA